MEENLPVTGAWRPGDHAGRRQFLTIAADRPFALDSGELLANVTVAYETWGTLAEDASNAVLVCHAWTGDSHAAGRAGPGHPTEGWWDAMIGPGRPIDTDRWFVVCANVLGGCQGSTGPASDGPDGRPYGSRFPVVTIRDMVRVQERLQAHLGVECWASVVGGSMGGMQVLEWAATYPRRVASIVPIATCLHSTAQQIAWGMIGRRAVRLDPRWNDGEYYDAAPGEGPHEGLAVARQARGAIHQAARAHRGPARAAQMAEAAIALLAAPARRRPRERDALADLQAKFENCAGRVLPAKTAKAVAQCVDGLESLKRVRELMAMVVSSKPVQIRRSA